MDGKVLALLIVLIVFGSATLQKWLKHKEATGGPADDEEKQALKARVNDLEERVKVLERIATDKSHRLSEEIDAL